MLDNTAKLGSVAPKKQNEFRGVSQIVNLKPSKTQEFQDRFKGKTTLMGKEGHIGIVKNTQKPIAKGGNGVNQPILKRSETFDSITNLQQFGHHQSSESMQSMSNANFFRVNHQ